MASLSLVLSHAAVAVVHVRTKVSGLPIRSGVQVYGAFERRTGSHGNPSNPWTCIRRNCHVLQSDQKEEWMPSSADCDSRNERNIRRHTAGRRKEWESKRSFPARVQAVDADSKQKDERNAGIQKESPEEKWRKIGQKNSGGVRDTRVDDRWKERENETSEKSLQSQETEAILCRRAVFLFLLCCYLRNKRLQPPNDDRTDPNAPSGVERTSKCTTSQDWISLSFSRSFALGKSERKD